MSRRLSRLEKLPAEIRHHLLSVLDVPQLKSLVHASPIFHSQYLHSRRFFLQKQVELTLGTAIVDAYFAYLYSVQTDDITDHDIHVVLPLYFTLTPKRCLPSTTKLTEDEALGMLMRHRQIVEPLVQYSAIQMLQCLNKQSFKQRPRGNGKNVSCSDMEVVRLTRAIYRYQLYHQAIGFAYMEVSEEDEEEAFLRKDIFMDYFCCLELWEAEELVSFDRFVWVMYHSMVDIIYSDNALSNQARSLGTFKLVTHISVPCIYLTSESRSCNDTGRTNVVWCSVTLRALAPENNPACPCRWPAQGRRIREAY